MPEGSDVMVTMNKVMHNALRRDLDRMRRVLEETAPVPSQRRAAIADHVTFTMARLHHHHTAEDNKLWPLLEKKDPSARETLTNFSEQHAASASGDRGARGAGLHPTTLAEGMRSDGEVLQGENRAT